MVTSLVPRGPAPQLILAAACWGVGTVVSKQAVAEIPPLTLLPIQLSFSVAFLLVAARRRNGPLGTAPHRRLGILGVLNPGLSYALGLLGLAQITASLSVLLWALEPVMILALAAVLLRERPGATLLALSAVALAGMVLILYDPAASGATAGVLLTLGGVACCAVYTVATRRWHGDAGSTLGVVLTQQGWALVFAAGLLAVTGGVGGDVLPSTLTPIALASAIASGILYYGLAYWLYVSALRRVPAGVAAVSFYLIPVFGVGAGVLVGERLGAAQWLGGLIVVLAVALIAWRTTAAGGGAVPALEPAHQVPVPGEPDPLTTRPAASLTGAVTRSPASRQDGT